MTKSALFLLTFGLLPAFLKAQSDTTKVEFKYNTIFNFGDKKNVKKLNAEDFYPVVLVIDGDSIYNTINNYELSRRIGKNNFKFDVITDPDSIRLILSDRVKSIILIKRAESPKK